ncbi:MAG: prepilin-type N-terminal cleavage/methylation domain-containing protein [Deltaproteobacteria bacterium]|nr:prepilin-type N-terminal cleavage/methylation domain-containing protein [Deltaproteobacteria bacterium]
MKARCCKRRGGFTLLELLIVIVIIGLIMLLGFPVVSRTLRGFRAQEGLKAVLNGFHSARARAAIMNKALRIDLTSSNTIGAIDPLAGGGQLQVFKYSGTDCSGTTSPLVPDPGSPANPLTGDGKRWDNFQFRELKDIGLCRTTTDAAEMSLGCVAATTVQFCVKPNGETTNLTQSSANDATVVYVQEYLQSGASSVTAIGNPMQVVVPRYRPARYNNVAVTTNACL